MMGPGGQGMMGPGMMGPGGQGMMGPGMMGQGGQGMMGPGMMGQGGQGMMGPGMMGQGGQGMMGPGMMGQGGQGMMGPGMMGQGGQGMMGPGMMGQGGQGMMGPGMMGQGGMMGAIAARVEEKPRVTKLRVVLTTDKGTFGAEEIDAFGVPVSPQPNDVGWGRVYIPFSRFSNGGRGVPAGQLQRILVCGNGEDSIYVRSISLFQENPADVITPKPAEESAEVAMNDSATLTTNLEGADRRATVYWDFDKADGITVQGVGEVGNVIFVAPGTYTVTVVAEPTNGTAAPRTATMHVVVPQPEMTGMMGQGMMGPGMMGPGMMGPGGQGMMGPGMMGPGGPGMMGPGMMGPNQGNR